MKTVLLIRHAKSSWADPDQSDMERPLNDRGRNDAPVMANRLKKRKVKIDLFLSSPAKRARQTAVLFMNELEAGKEQLQIAAQLYLADAATFEETISQLDDKVDTVAVFSHNPGITDFVNRLTRVTVDHMPTTAVYAIRMHSNNWHDFATAKKDFLFFDYPKNKEV